MGEKQPNIIYVFADQWRRQAVGYANEDAVQTPVIDEFAKESTVFNQAVSVAPLCSPHRSSLLTGKYPYSTGVYTNCKVGLNIMLKEEEICIGDVLKKEGYRTGYIGKWHLDLPELNVTDTPESEAKGWDAYTPPGPKRHGFDYWYSYGAWDSHLTPHYWADTPEKIHVEQWSVEHETDKAIEFISENTEDPFALFVSWNPPHSPFAEVPQKYLNLFEDLPKTFRENVHTDTFSVHTGEEIEGGLDELFEKQKQYFAAIAGLDDNFGRLLDCIEQKGLHDNTIIVLTADHGEMMGSHGIMAKHVWYEESVGIPFAIRWPDKIARKQTDCLLNTVDIMPTLLGLAGIDCPQTVEGENLAPYLLGEEKTTPDAVFLSAYPGRLVAVEAFKEQGLNHLAAGWRAVRTNDYTFVIHKGYEPGASMEILLYHLKEDPYQLQPQKITNPKQENESVQVLYEKLKEWLREIDDPFVEGLL